MSSFLTVIRTARVRVVVRCRLVSAQLIVPTVLSNEKCLALPPIALGFAKDDYGNTDCRRCARLCRLDSRRRRRTQGTERFSSEDRCRVYRRWDRDVYFLSLPIRLLVMETIGSPRHLLTATPSEASAETPGAGPSPFASAALSE